MSVFVATFNGVSVSAAQDVFEIVAPANSRVAIREIRLGQTSDAGDAQAELLGVQILRGHDTAGSGGATATPVNLSPASGAAAAGATVKTNNTTLASTGSPATLLSDALNEQRSPWVYRPDRDARPIIEKSQRCVVRIAAPADAITLNGTLVFEETGRAGPISA